MSANEVKCKQDMSGRKKYVGIIPPSLYKAARGEDAGAGEEKVPTSFY